MSAVPLSLLDTGAADAAVGVGVVAGAGAGAVELHNFRRPIRNNCCCVAEDTFHRHGIEGRHAVYPHWVPNGQLQHQRTTSH